MNSSATIIKALLEDEEDDEAKEAELPGHISGIHGDLLRVLEQFGVSADRIKTRYSDVYVMCRDYQEAYKIREAGIWKSMAQVVRTNPDHPDAREFPILVDIPFANLSGHVRGTLFGESEDEEDDDLKDVQGEPPEDYSSDFRLRNMRFKSKSEVNTGTKVLWRGYKVYKGISRPTEWTPQQDQYYKISGCDWHRVGKFYKVPPGKEIGSWSVRPGPKQGSTHVELNGVGHSYPSWEEFFANAVKPELYYPNMKMQGMPFNRPPDQRF